MGPISAYLTSDPETIKDVFTSKNCVNKPEIIMNGITKTGGIGLLSSNGMWFKFMWNHSYFYQFFSFLSEPVWSRHRKILNKTFLHKNLLSFFPIFNEAVNDLIMEIDANLVKENNVDMLKLFHNFTLKITSSKIFYNVIIIWNGKVLISLLER